MQPEHQEISVSALYCQAPMEVSKGREDQGMARGQRLERSMIMEFSTATDIPSSVQGNNHRDICRLIVVPGTLLLVLGVVVCYLNRGDIKAISLIQAEEYGVENRLHNKPHPAIELRAVVPQHNLWDLPQLILIIVWFKGYMLLHEFDLFDHHLAPLTAEKGNRINLRKHLLAHLMDWSFTQVFTTFTSPVPGYVWDRILDGIIQGMIYRPVRLH